MFQIKLSESTAARRRIFVYLVDVTDGYTPETGITAPTIEYSKNGGAQSTGGGTFTEVGDGVYYYETTTGEIDTLGMFNLRVVESGVSREYQAMVQIVAYDPYDATALGLTNLDATISSRASQASVDTIDSNVDDILVDTGTDIPAALAVIDSNVDDILVDTGTDIPAVLGVIDSNVDLILIDTSTDIPAALAIIDSNVDDILVDTGTDIPSTLAVIDSNVDDILVDTGTDIPATLATIASYIDTEVDAIKAKTDQLVFTTANRVDATALGTGTALDTYQAKVLMLDDDGATADRYVVIWHKNGQPVTSGITVPVIQVFDASGVDIIAATAMTEISSTGTYIYVTLTDPERIADGKSYIAKVTATIDSATRTWYQPVGRDG